MRINKPTNGTKTAFDRYMQCNVSLQPPLHPTHMSYSRLVVQCHDAINRRIIDCIDPLHAEPLHQSIEFEQRVDVDCFDCLLAASNQNKQVFLFIQKSLPRKSTKTHRIHSFQVHKPHHSTVLTPRCEQSDRRQAGLPCKLSG